MRRNEMSEIRVALNDAMLKVMSTQFKKDAKTEHEIVESYGYKIYKYDGAFRIRNDKTQKCISLRPCNSYRYNWKLEYGDTYADEKRVKTLEELKVVDLVGILEKPRNNVYKSLQWGYVDDVHSKYRERKEQLRSAKWNVEYHSGRINDIQKKIAELQKDLVYESKQLARYETNLTNIKKEVGIA